MILNIPLIIISMLESINPIIFPRGKFVIPKFYELWKQAQDVFGILEFNFINSITAPLSLG